MKVLVISDITLESLNRKQLINSLCSYSFIFSEDLLSELESFDRFNNFDLIYIHFDCYFKRYRKEFITQLIDSIMNLSKKTERVITVSNLISVGWLEDSLINSYGMVSSCTKFFKEQIDSLLKKHNVYFLDIDSLIRDVGVSNTYNYNLGHLYQLPYTKVFLDKFAKYVDNFITKIKTPDKKVIILDCDNTLWNGIVGEDGINGVKCDLNEDGIVYYHFQQFLKTRKSMGFLLCLCSKNNEEDVKHVFFNKRMPLQWDDFVVKKVNWNNKVQNIKEIAGELNLGLDSFIFIDDSEFEINSINEVFPEVTLFKMTKNYNEFLELTGDVNFTKKILTEEDFIKTELYLTEVERDALQQSSTSFADYIKSLQIEIEIQENLETDLLRVSQLTEKTNQFNFNKRYFSVEELKEYLSIGKLSCFTLRVSDKYGDYGLVGVILIEKQSNNIILENYILSCRILGRHIEFDFFEKVKKLIREKYNKDIKGIKFFKTQKNVPAQNFYNQIIQKNEF